MDRFTYKKNTIATAFRTKLIERFVLTAIMDIANVKIIYSIFGHKTNTCVPGTKPINGMYPACKFALTALTECLRQEVSYNEMGIKVSVRQKCKKIIIMQSFWFWWSFLLHVIPFQLEYQSRFSGKWHTHNPWIWW